MASRISISSENLKRVFPDIYRDFFAQCNLVCSAPKNVTWSGEQMVRFGGLTVRQAIPNRTYVGLTPVFEKKGIKVVSLKFFDPLEQRFKEGRLDEHQKNNTEEHLAVFLKRFGNLDINNGFEIHVLTELPFEHALGPSGSFFVALITAFLLYYKLITPNDISLWSESSVSSLINDPEKKFDFVFRLIRQWEILNYAVSSGASLFISLLPTTTPILFFSHHKQGVPNTVLEKIKKNKLEMDDFEFVDNNMYYWGARTTEIFEEHMGWPWPFDWGVIYNGDPHAMLDTTFSLQEIQKELSDCGNEITKIFDPLMQDKTEETKPKFYNICKQDNLPPLWDSYLGSLHILSLRLLLTIKNIIEKGFAKQPMLNFFDLMNKVHTVLFFLIFYSADTVSVKANEYITLFLEKKIGHGMVGAKVSSVSTRSNILFAVPSLVARPYINSLLKNLRAKINSNITLDYASWIDGYEKEGGVKIEQFVAQGIYSDLIGSNAKKFKIWNKKEGIKTVLINNEDEIKKKQYDIILDKINQEVYIRGQEVNSKELPSKKAIIEIIGFLFDHPQQIFNNTQLPKNNYTEYRNELQGKIISPLNKLLKKIAGKDLGVKLSGKLMNYCVEFNSRDLQIGVIERI